jgi:hypothetical protein
MLKPVFGYNYARDAYVLRGVGKHLGPVLRPDRRIHHERSWGGGDRRQRAHLT